MTRAVIFAYGDVGVRCLATVLAHEIDVPLVVTHEDDPAETRWYQSVADFARDRDIAVITAETTTAAQVMERVASLRPDFIFSFYYRRMLPEALLAIARRGAINMHGSLLPQFRGRAPINWAILQGAAQTGASLHYMTGKPDAGAIIAQRAVRILPDDTAVDVFRKVCAAAESILDAALPSLIEGTSEAVEQDLAAGNYFGARRPDDGIIDWSQPAQRIHDLVRAVAPPFPGARTTIDGRPARFLRTLRTFDIVGRQSRPVLFELDGRCYAECGDGRSLRLLSVEIDGAAVDLATLARRLACRPIDLPLRVSA